MLFSEFFEMHGDRLYSDDNAIMGGIANFQGIPVTVIAQVKGRNLDENKRTNFSMPHPEGYRKALRLAKQAEKFHRPIICFIDTPGVITSYSIHYTKLYEKSCTFNIGSILSTTVIVVCLVTSFPDSSLKVTSILTGVPTFELLKDDLLRVVSAIVQLSLAEVRNNFV